MAGLVGQILLSLLNGQKPQTRSLLPMALMAMAVLPVLLLALGFVAVAGYFALEPVTSPAVAAVVVAALLLLLAIILLLVILLYQRQPAPPAESNPILQAVLDQLGSQGNGDGKVDGKGGLGARGAAIGIAALLGLALGYSPALRRLVAGVVASLIKDAE